MRTKKNTEDRKKALIFALEKSLGIVTTACKSANVTRKTHYQWMQEDEEYKKAVEDVDNVTLDFAESQLHKQIAGGNPTSTIFYLKTKGKKRGYIEKQEIEHSGKIEGGTKFVTREELSDDEKEDIGYIES